MMMVIGARKAGGEPLGDMGILAWKHPNCIKGVGVREGAVERTAREKISRATAKTGFIPLRSPGRFQVTSSYLPRWRLMTVCLSSFVLLSGRLLWHIQMRSDEP
jgi:hypothetical protein